MYLITGATGNVGGKSTSYTSRDTPCEPWSATQLGRTFPTTSRSPVGDLDDPASIDAAAKGVDAVFHMQASPFVTQTETVIGAARHAGVDRIVAMTSMGSVLEPLPTMGTFFRAREDRLRASGLKVIFLRPNALMSDALWWKDSIKESGTVSDPCGEGRMPCVDSDDIAAVAAVTLTQPGHEGHGYLLGGPEALTTREQVDILADVLGEPIELIDVTPHEHAEATVAQGAPEQMGPVIENLYTMFRTGRAGVLTDDIRIVTGREPGTFRAWCAQRERLLLRKTSHPRAPTGTPA